MVVISNNAIVCDPRVACPARSTLIITICSFLKETTSDSPEFSEQGACLNHRKASPSQIRRKGLITLRCPCFQAYEDIIAVSCSPNGRQRKEAMQHIPHPEYHDSDLSAGTGFSSALSAGWPATLQVNTACKGRDSHHQIKKALEEAQEQNELLAITCVL